MNTYTFEVAAMGTHDSVYTLFHDVTMESSLPLNLEWQMWHRYDRT